MLFEYLYKLRDFYEDEFFDEYLVHHKEDDEEWIPMGEWFSELRMHQFSDGMLTHWAELRVLYQTIDYYETRALVAAGSNPSFEELLISLQSEVGDPDSGCTGLN